MGRILFEVDFAPTNTANRLKVDNLMETCCILVCLMVQMVLHWHRSHLDNASRVLVTTLEQFPVEDDQFTDIVSAV